MSELHPVSEPGAEVVAASPKSLDTVLLHGMAWTAGAKWLSQILSWAATLAVARILSPADYGVVGMAMVALSLIALVSEFGVTTAIVTLRDITEADMRRLNAMALMLGIASFTVAAALAKPLGSYFHSRELPAVIIAQSFVYIVVSFQSVPNGRLQRDLRFKRLASIDVARSMVAAGAALTLAVVGMRYWALVLAELIAATTQSIMLVRSAGIGFEWNEFARVRRAVVFSWRTLVGSLAWYVYSNADFLVAGRVLGAVALGSYSFAWQLTSLPVEKVTALVGRVTPAFLAAASEDGPALRRYVARITEGISLLTFPTTVGMAFVAGDVIPLVFGSKWQMAVVPLRFLAGGMLLRSIVPVLSNAMRALRDVRFLMWHSITIATILPAAFFAAAHLGGLRGIALAWFVLYPIAVIPQYWRAVRIGAMDPGSYVRAVLPAIEGTVIMALVVMAVRFGMINQSPALRCVLEVVAGATVYCAVVFLRHGARVRGVMAFMRRRDAQA